LGDWCAGDYYSIDPGGYSGVFLLVVFKAFTKEEVGTCG